MSKERLVITQELCGHVKILLKGGATMKEAAAMAGISQATVSRIKAADFEIVKYNMMTDRRRIMENDRKVDRKIEELRGQLQEKVHGQIDGQIRMELPAEEKEEYSEQTKMMRFQAGQVALLLQKMEKMNDMMGQILRAIRKE